MKFIKRIMLFVIALLIGLNVLIVNVKADETALYWHFVTRYTTENGFTQVTEYKCEQGTTKHGTCSSSSGYLWNYYEYATGSLWEVITY